MHHDSLSSDHSAGKTPPRILVTGASGRVGLPTVQALAAQRYSVRAISSRSNGLPTIPQVEWFAMDWLTDGDFEAALDGCVGVIHLGAELSDIGKMQQVNVIATERLAAAAEKSPDLKSFVYASSISVYGSPAVRVVTEETPTVSSDRDAPSEHWAEPFLRHYARTKVQAERSIRRILNATSCTVFRPTVIVDDARIRGIVELSAARRLLQSYRVPHFIHVEDVAHAYVWALERGLGGDKPTHDVFNLSEDDREDDDLLSMLARAEALSGRAGYRPFIALPGTLDRLRMRAKFRVASRRFPLGSCRFSGAKLRGAGFQFKLGMRAAEARVFGPSRTAHP